MNDSVWYYTRGDSENGPVSTPQIKALASAGKIRPDDLVWKEGMENWAPARNVAELFPESAREKRPVPDSVLKSSAPTGGPIIVPHSQGSDAQLFARPISRITLIVGLFVVLLARGCDSLDRRYADRLLAKVDASERRFEEDRTRERRPLEVEQSQLASLQNRSAPQQQRLTQVNQLLAKMIVDEAAQRQQREREVWTGFRQTAREAEDEHRIWGFWREAAFLIGTLILTVGLLAVSFDSSGPERWICLSILGAIVFSVYLS
jgi:hypothetical protein